MFQLYADSRVWGPALQRFEAGQNACCYANWDVWLLFRFLRRRQQLDFTQAPIQEIIII